MWPLIPEDWYQINDHDTKATILTRRAELSLEVQNYTQALSFSDKALEQLHQGRAMELLGTAHIANFVRVHQMSGIIGAFVGDRQRAMNAIEKIDAGQLSRYRVQGPKHPALHQIQIGNMTD